MTPMRRGRTRTAFLGTSPARLIPLIIPEIKGNSVLDVGCGAGVMGHCIRNLWIDTEGGDIQKFDWQLRKIKDASPDLLVGMDIHSESLARCQYHRTYDLLCRADAASLPFSDASFDTVICIETLEHLAKERATAALRELERVARLRVVITVPRRAVHPRSGKDDRKFLNYEGDDQEVIEWLRTQTHRCAFSVQEFRRLGYRCGRRNPGRAFGRTIGPFVRFFDNYISITRVILAVKDVG